MNAFDNDNDRERFSRSRALLGEEAMETLAASRVAVFGLGGVGGHCAEALARAGIGALDLFDGDSIALSNCNRQMFATEQTLGMRKVQAAKERIALLSPRCRVTAHDLFVLPETVGAIDFSAFGYVVDAIDTIAPKCALLVEAMKRHVRIISSMGAGAKTDITQVRFADLWDTYHCGLSKAVRTRLKRAGMHHHPLPVVFCTQQACQEAIVRVEGERNKKTTTGTVSYMPAVFGCYLAQYVIDRL